MSFTTFYYMQQYWTGPKEDYGFIPVKDMAQAFQETHVHQHNEELLQAAFEPPKDSIPELDPLVRSKYAPSTL